MVGLVTTPVRDQCSRPASNSPPKYRGSVAVPFTWSETVGEVVWGRCETTWDHSEWVPQYTHVVPAHHLLIIVLVTRSSTSQVYIAKHFGQPPLLPGRQPFNNNMAHNRPGTMNAFPSHPFGAGRPFPHHNFQTPHHAFLQPPPLPGQGPQMLHLFTSPRPDFEPFWAEDPSIAMLPAEHRRPIPRFVTTRVSWLVYFITYLMYLLGFWWIVSSFRSVHRPGSPDTSIDYVQLSREDFE